MSAYYFRMVLLPVSFDPHALAMALCLATLLEDDHVDSDFAFTHGWIPSVADWLRAEVQRELESQP